ncbi:MAG: AAA family ATPase, partial [Deltaproteobacteria bacterium]
MLRRNRQVPMYLDHYQLKLMPFEIGPDPKFLWLGSKHEEAFAILRYGILESKGFIVIIGEPGTGKSTLLNATAANFGSNIRFAKITDPALDEMDFFNFVADAFEMGKTFQSKAEFLIRLGEFVKDAGAQSKKVILVIDEAQRLTPAMLEQIRVFSNVETPGQKVVSCIFAGQTEFLDMVKQNRALAQRVFFSHIIQPLTEPEADDYITHRLKVAGTEEAIFTSAAVQEVFRLSGGNPRLINILCDQALLCGYALDKKKIGPELIKESTENTLIPLHTQKEPAAAAQKEDPAKQSTSAEPTAETTTGPSRIAPANTDIKTPGRKTAYWAPITLAVVLGLAAYFYLNDGFRAASKGSRTDPEPAHSSGQPAEPAPASEIGRIQGQMLELRRQKDDTETRLRELQTRFGPLEKDQQELKAAKARVAEFESAVASKDKDLTVAGQKLAELEKALAQEKSSKDRLNADVSSKDAAIAEFQKKLESFASNQASLKGAVDTFTKENTRLQAQLVEINNQKGAAEARLGEVEKQNTGLAADTNELKSARDRASQLAAAVSERDKKLIQFEQEFGDLEKALAKEKAAKDQTGVELSSRQAAIADLQRRLEAARSAQLKLEADIQNTQRENARLQSQLQEMKAQKPALPPTPAPARAPVISQPAPVPSDTAGAAPDPAGVIDYVIKRKSQ